MNRTEFLRLSPLVLEAVWSLIAHDCFMLHKRFPSLYLRVKGIALRSEPSGAPGEDSLLSAFNLACSLYPRPVLCLQRSAVLVSMLRRRGIPARMVIGAQKLPFKAHAWVEVNGRILDDRLAEREQFHVLEVC